MTAAGGARRRQTSLFAREDVARRDPLAGVAPAARAWVAAHRARWSIDVRAVATCDGCALFGLCAWHGSDGPTVRRRRRSSEGV